MLFPESIDEQYDRAGGDRLQVLIVGAGIAGATLAQLLRAQGIHPVLIDRSPEPARMTDDRHAGYMLALMPMVDPVFAELDLQGEYRARSVEFERFTIHSRTGAVLRSDRLGELLSPFGEYRGIARGELMATLTASGCPVAFGTTVTDLVEGEGVSVTLDTRSDGPAGSGASGTTTERTCAFDLVVIADGLRSRTREFMPGGHGTTAVDTGWGGWVAWAPADGDPGEGTEVWGDGFFLGAYPVKGGIGVFLGCPDTRWPLGARRFADEVRRGLSTLSPRVDSALTAVAEADDPYFWPLRDARAPQWTSGHTVLLGDASAGFLPTAGIGAGLAMESAGVLARMLASATRQSLPEALRTYEDEQRPRVEKAQENSRRLADLMFTSSRLVGGARELGVRLVSLKVALGPIISLLRHPALSPSSAPSPSPARR